MALFGAKYQKLFEDKDTATSLGVQYFLIKSFKQSWLISKPLNLNTVKNLPTLPQTWINLVEIDFHASFFFLEYQWHHLTH